MGASRPVPEKVQEALALVSAGTTFAEAAEHAGMRTQSLWERWQRLMGPESPHGVEMRKRADEALAAGARAGALRAVELMLADLEAPTSLPEERRAHLLAFTRVLGRLDGSKVAESNSRFADALADALSRRIGAASIDAGGTVCSPSAPTGAIASRNDASEAEIVADAPVPHSTKPSESA